MISLKDVDFPYYKDSVNDEEIFKNIEKIKKINFRKKSRDILTLFRVYIDFKRDEKLLIITDYFSQETRIRSKFDNNISPYDFFQKNRGKIISELGPLVTYQEIDKYLWSHAKFCSTFPLIVAKEVISLFKPNRILDPSAGHGDRLIAAIINNCEYIGIDPNENMEDKYKQIIDFFKKDHRKYKVHKKCFEDFVIEPNSFDLVFTSPPFFNLETYIDSPTQSIEKFPDFESWKKGFLEPLLEKSIEAVGPGGHIAIYLNDVREFKIETEGREIMKRHKNIEFFGYIDWVNGKYPKKIIVWKKL